MVQVKMGSNILGANELLARKNRNLFEERELLVVNLMSSPGSGKTTILERTIEALEGRLKLGVIEGDLYTDRDAQRIEQKGAPVVQINTEGACHLDAGMISGVLAKLETRELDLMVIENVGNLVCPAEFDLGEDCRVVVISTAEGNDKPLKYPLIFRQADAILINKIDLIPYTDFNLSQFKQDAAQINPDAQMFEVSARTGEGMEKWAEWLVARVEEKRVSCNKKG